MSIQSDMERQPLAISELPLVLRMALKVLGAGLLGAAIVVWLGPDRPDLPALDLMKLAISAFFALGGLACLGLSTKSRGPVFETQQTL